MDCGPPGSSVHGASPGKNTGVGCHGLLQGMFPTQGSNPGLPHCRQILYHLSTWQYFSIFLPLLPVELNSKLYLCWVLGGRIGDFCFVLVRYPGTVGFSAPIPGPYPSLRSNGSLPESGCRPISPSSWRLWRCISRESGEMQKVSMSSSPAPSHHVQPLQMNESLSGDLPSCFHEYPVEIHKRELCTGVQCPIISTLPCLFFPEF